MPRPFRNRTPGASAATVAAGAGTSYMVVGTLIAGLGAYGFQLLAGRALGPEEFAPVSALWTIQFLMFTILLFPLEQLTIRRIVLGGEASGPPTRVLLAVIGGSTALLTLFAVATRATFFNDDLAFALLIGLLVLGYSVFALGRGHLAGDLRYRAYGVVTAAESVFRLILAALIVAAGGKAVGLGWSLVLAPVVVVLVSPWRPPRLRPARPVPGAANFLAGFVVATAASQTILASGPLVVAALGASDAEVSVFFETLLLLRAPVTISYSLVARFLPVLTTLVRTGRLERVRAWGWRIGAGGMAAAPLAGVASAFIGPAVVALLLGERFRPGASTAGLLAAAMVLATAALFLQQCLVAGGATGRQALAWAFGLATGLIALALVSGSASLRVSTAVLVGEVAALVLLTAAVATLRPR